MGIPGMTAEEKVLLSHVCDMISAARGGKARFDGFFNPREREIAQMALNGEHCSSFAFYGGYADAERTMLGVFPRDTDIPAKSPEEIFPIVCLSFIFPPSRPLSHRDFLGAAMSLMLKRETIGDILVESGRCILFTTRPAALVLQTELDKVGNVGVKIMPAPQNVDFSASFSYIKGTVSSLRLDCVLALLLRCSRAEAQQMIKSGGVMLNHLQQQSPARDVDPGDIISVSGHGRFLVGEIGGMSRKGRINISCKKYL